MLSSKDLQKTIISLLSNEEKEVAVSKISELLYKDKKWVDFLLEKIDRELDLEAKPIRRRTNRSRSRSRSYNKLLTIVIQEEEAFLLAQGAIQTIAIKIIIDIIGVVEVDLEVDQIKIGADQINL